MNILFLGLLFFGFASMNQCFSLVDEFGNTIPDTGVTTTLGVNLTTVPSSEQIRQQVGTAFNQLTPEQQVAVTQTLKNAAGAVTVDDMQKVLELTDGTELGRVLRGGETAVKMGILLNTIDSGVRSGYNTVKSGVGTAYNAVTGTWVANNRAADITAKVAAGTGAALLVGGGAAAAGRAIYKKVTTPTWVKTAKNAVSAYAKIRKNCIKYENLLTSLAGFTDKSSLKKRAAAQGNLNSVLNSFNNFVAKTTTLDKYIAYRVAAVGQICQVDIRLQKDLPSPDAQTDARDNAIDRTDGSNFGYEEACGEYLRVTNTKLAGSIVNQTPPPPVLVSPTPVSSSVIPSTASLSSLPSSTPSSLRPPTSRTSSSTTSSLRPATTTTRSTRR